MRKCNVKDVLLVVLLWSARHWHMTVITSNVKVVRKRNVKMCESAI